jgi:hypothetical protein
MKLYQPTPAELAAAGALLCARFPDDEPRIGRGLNLIARLRYETAADRNGIWQRLDLPIRVNADPGWCIDSTPDERRNASDSNEATPHSYEIRPDGVQLCQCWDHTITSKPCRHVYAVRAYRAIVNAKLDGMAQRHALDLRPAGRYEGLYDVVDCWGMTIASVIYHVRTDKWTCESDHDVASFAAWLATDEAMAEIVRPRAREEYQNV